MSRSNHSGDGGNSFADEVSGGTGSAGESENTEGFRDILAEFAALVGWDIGEDSQDGSAGLHDEAASQPCVSEFPVETCQCTVNQISEVAARIGWHLRNYPELLADFYKGFAKGLELRGGEKLDRH